MKSLKTFVKKLLVCVIIAACVVNSNYYAVNASVQDESSTRAVGTVTGIQDNDTITVVMYNNYISYNAQTDADGGYAFNDIACGTYFIKIDTAGYSIPDPQKVVVSEGVNEIPQLTVSKMSDTDYYYQWKADETYFGYEESAGIVEPWKVEFMDSDIYPSDSSASVKLYDKYGIILSDEEESWSADYAARFYELYSEIPNYNTKQSKWVLTKKHINNDLLITYGDEADVVEISIDAFNNSVPRKAKVNETVGTYFSNRLYNALVRYVTRSGEDVDAVDYILTNKFGCSIKIQDYEQLTKGVTDETDAAFQMFKPEELVSILSMFQEMPEGFHKIDGLKYLVRRTDGTKNPIYPEAAAVSWVNNDPGYIEFMESLFTGEQISDTFRLILHEKTHFLWKYLFSDSLKSKWEEIGGWHEDKTAASGWSTSKQTEFVSAYGHDINPDEDMAESVASYIINPDKLEARAIEKYNFIRDYIMNGEIYKTQIREDLQFDVYNLYPDYAYPGRIVDMKLETTGKAEEDKQVKITIKLDTHGDSQYGADKALMRITDSTGNQMYETWLYPVDGDNSELSGTFDISRYSNCGYWKCTSLTLYDNAGNERYCNDNNFGWKLCINNPLADTTAPEYVDDSIHIDTTTEDIGEGHTVTHVFVRFKAQDNVKLKEGINSCYCEIANESTDSYSKAAWGIIDQATGICTVQFDFSEYQSSGVYAVKHIEIVDEAGNIARYNFYKDGSGAKSYTTFEYVSDKSDYEAPELDVNKISISAVPTHPENPDGETKVAIKVYIRDDLSGFNHGGYELLDPQGNIHHYWFYSDSYDKTYFEGDPAEWKEYDINVVLPKGSALGTWGLRCMDVIDIASNRRSYNFTEIVHFKVDENNNLEVKAEADQSEIEKGGTVTISTHLSNEGTGIYTYKYIMYDPIAKQWTKLKDYTADSTFAWTPEYAGEKWIYVDVMDAGGKVVRSNEVKINVSGSNDELSCEMSNDAGSCPISGERVTFTALAKGGNGSFTYKFIVYNKTTEVWAKLRDYSENNTFVWTAGDAGDRDFYVDVKDGLGNVVRSRVNNIVVVSKPVVELKASAAALSAGEKLTLTASTDISNCTYKFLIYNSATNQWFKLQDFSGKNTFTWTAGSSGTRQFYVDVKDADGNVTRSKVVNVSIGSEGALSVKTIVSAKASKPGDKITFTASASGGKTGYTYKLVVYNKTTKTWGLVQNFSSNNKITWTAGSAGDREFYIDVKDASGKVVRSSVMNVKTSN